MSKVAYLIITDLHMSASHKDNRFNYKSELHEVLTDIVNVIQKYKSNGYKVKLLFLGDIVDRSYKSIPEAIALVQLFVQLATMTNGMYSVVGNHEMSFYKDNPFWSLFKEVESRYMNLVINRSWQPTGAITLVKIVDELIDGNVRFLFNHHPTPLVTAKEFDGVTVGLFHKDLINKSIMDEMQKNFGMDIFDAGHVDFTRLSVLDNYDYAFLGHMHKAYGKYINVDDVSGWKCSLYYLGSLGRPNVTEVDDKFLKRNIPAVLISNGIFESVQDNFISLTERKDSVREDVVKRKKELYEKSIQIKRCSDFLPNTDDPISNLFTCVASDVVATELLNSLYKDEVSEREVSLENLYKEALYYN